MWRLGLSTSHSTRRRWLYLKRRDDPDAFFGGVERDCFSTPPLLEVVGPKAAADPDQFLLACIG
jgi:hypothetical protein